MNVGKMPTQNIVEVGKMAVYQTYKYLIGGTSMSLLDALWGSCC